jgi:uncharacterized protein YdgA (DUF945 family)
MKRWVVVLLVVLAAVILVSPGIVGHLAERNLESNLEWAASASGDVTVAGGSFDRGWFTSEGTRRIEIRNEQLRSLIADLTDVPGTAAPPVLIVSTRLDHGLIPVTSMARESGSLAPALASAVSTVALDPGNSELIAVPGEILTRVGLTGASSSHYQLAAGAFEDASTRAEWQGADVTVRLDPAAASLGFDAVIEPLVVASGEDTVSLGRMVLDGEQRATPYGFNVGSIAAEVASLTSGATVLGPLSLDASTELAGERVNGTMAMRVQDVVVPAFGNVTTDLNIAVEGLDAASLQGIVAAVEQAQASAAPDEALANLYPLIHDDVQRLLAAGVEIRVEQLDVLLPQGPVSSKLRVALPQTDSSEFSWAGLLLALHASADVSVPVAVMEKAQAVNPQAGALIAMGFLQKEGDVYRLQAEYAKGLLTVNGAPMPIPLPAAAR